MEVSKKKDFMSKLTLSGRKNTSSPRTPKTKKETVSLHRELLKQESSPNTSEYQCSTPIIRRRGYCCFLDESPSQLNPEDVGSPQSPFQFTQEHRGALDVTWKWSKSPTVETQPIIRKLQPRRHLRTKYENNANTQFTESPKRIPLKGFYKFQRELEEYTKKESDNKLSEDKNTNDEDNIETQMSPFGTFQNKQHLDENINPLDATESMFELDDSFTAKLDRVEDEQTNVAEPIKNTTFPDSSFDDYFIDLDIKADPIENKSVAASVAPQQPLPPKIVEEIKQDENFFDSSDDIFLSIPLDEIVSQAQSQISNQTEETAARIISGRNINGVSKLPQQRTEFTRNKSASQITTTQNSQQPLGVFQRNKSTSSFELKHKNATSSNSYNPNKCLKVVPEMSSTLPSSGKCTQEEIQRKRLEAQQRLRAARTQKFKR